MRNRQTDPRMGRADVIARQGQDQKIGATARVTKQTNETTRGTTQESKDTKPGEDEREGIGRTAAPRRSLRCLFTALALGLISLPTGCMGPMLHQRSVAFVEPPRERLQASLANDRIKVSDVLQFTLTDGSTVSLNGAYTVGPDGAVELSGYGKVHVAGKTLEEAKQAMQEVMAAKSALRAAFDLDRCEYYVVTVTADGVQDLTRSPLAGKTTVKDAVHGIPRLSNKVLWVVRPTPDESVKEQVLAVDWEAISRLDDNRTNYVLKRGDWLFVADEPTSGFGRFFGAFTSMLSSRKSETYDAPRPVDRPASPQHRVDDIVNPGAERI